MGATLDRSRPFGTVHGSDTGACYEQDHKEFDNEGKEIVKSSSPRPGSSAELRVVASVNTSVLVTRDENGNLSKNGQILDTEAMEAEELRELADSMGLKLHRMTGKAKALVAITEAAVPVDQLSQQLA